MENWEYKELFEVIHELYQDFLEEGKSYRHAIAKLSDDFYKIGKIEDYIADVAIGELALSQGKIYVGRAKYLIERLNKFDPKVAEGELTTEELADLTKRMQAILIALKTVEIDENPYCD